MRIVRAAPGVIGAARPAGFSADPRRRGNSGQLDVIGLELAAHGEADPDARWRRTRPL